MQTVINATEGSCMSAYQNGIDLRGNYNNSFYKGPNTTGKCTSAFRGYSPQQAVEVKSLS